MNWKDYNILHWKKNSITKKLKIDNTRILLLDLDKTLMPPEKGIKNLIAIDNKENMIWVAQLPKVPYVSYSEINIINNKLFALAGSMLCEINIKTGKILNEKFVK